VQYDHVEVKNRTVFWRTCVTLPLFRTVQTQYWKVMQSLQGEFIELGNISGWPL